MYPLSCTRFTIFIFSGISTIIVLLVMCANINGVTQSVYYSEYNAYYCGNDLQRTCLHHLICVTVHKI
jgi:hypothetical protein